MVIARSSAAATLLSLVCSCASAPPPEPTDAPASSLAVLPLLNVSAEPEESDYLAQGISRAVITKLTQAGLRVTPWGTARRYQNSDQRAEDIARELNVDAVLVGTFELAEDQILTTLSLVEVETGLQSWTDEFQAPYASVFEVQRRIATGAARSLKRELTGSEEDVLAAAASDSVEAYDFYLQGAHLLQRGDREAAEVARQYFGQAVARDPDLAEAHVGLGAVFHMRYLYGWGGGLENLELAEASFERALELDPESMSARRGLIMAAFYRGDSEAVLLQGKLAAQSSPQDDVNAILVRAEAYAYGGLEDRSLPLFRRVIEIDPLNEGAHWQLLAAAHNAGEPEMAVETHETYRRAFGEPPDLLTYVADCYQLLGDRETARAYYQKAMEVTRSSGAPLLPDTFFYYGLFLEVENEAEEARKIWREGLDFVRPRLEEHPDDVRMRILLALFQGLLGDRTTLQEELDRALTSTDIAPWELHFLPLVWVRFGETERAVALLRETLRRGKHSRLWRRAFAIASVGIDEEAFAPFLREDEALQRRLREIY